MKRFIALFLLSVLAVSPASFALGADVSISDSKQVSDSAYLGGKVDSVGEGTENVAINETNFPDEKFRAYVSDELDKSKDGNLSKEEIADVTDITVREQGISNLKGIEYFTALTNLTCDTNQLKELDVSKNTALEYLYCDKNQLTALNVSNNTKLTYLCCYSNLLTELDVSNNSALQTLYCDKNQLTALDVSNNTKLTYLSCYSNQLTKLDVSNNSALQTLYCYSNQLTALDVSNNTALKELECYSNQLTALDVSNNTELTDLQCHENQLTSLDVSKNTALQYLYCYSNQLTELDVSSSTALEYLYCDNNQLTALDVSNNTKLKHLYCDKNQLTALDVSNNTALEDLLCNGQNTSGSNIIYTGDATYPYEHIFSWDISADKIANISSVSATSYEGGIARFSSRPSTVTYNYATGKGNMDVTLSGLSLFIEINKTIFPDEKFRAYVSNNFDSDKDGYISDEEMTAIKAATSVDVSGQGISSLKGIEYFTAITYLNCSNNQLTALDLSKNTALKWLHCYGNQLTALDVSKNTALEYLFCTNNQLTALDVSKNTALIELDCGNNQLTALDVSNNTALTGLACAGQKVSGFSVIFTGDTSSPYKIDFSGYISTGNFTNISSFTAKDSNDAEITATYADGVAQFASLPSTVTYNYATGNSKWVMDVTMSDFSLFIEINGTIFPDEAFRAYVSDNFDSDKDGYLSEEEMTAIKAATSVDVSGQGISSLKGIEYFTALTTLNCSNNQLTALDLSKNTALQSLQCNNNQLSELDLRSCPSLAPNSITADSNVRIIHGNMDGLPSFTDHSLILSGQLGLDFYANVPEGTNTEGAYTDFTVNDKTGSPEMFSNADKIGDDYRFTCYINSVQMADTITAKFCYSNDTKNMAAVQDCRVTDYLDAIISSTDLSAKSPDLVALAEAIKDYGHYVQIPLSRYNSWDIGTDHAEIECVNKNIDSDSADIKAKLEAYKHSKNIEGSGIENLTYDLELDSEITLNIYLTPGNDAGNVSAYITDDYGDFDGKTNMAVYDPSENAYVVTIGGISAHKLGRFYTVSITTGKGSGFTVKMSALSYANGVMQAENDGENIDDDLKRAVISLYKYYAATMKYRGEPLAE